MRKRILFVIVVVTVLLIGGIIAMIIFSKEPNVESFDVADYSSYVRDFPSDKVLGSIDSAESAKEKAEVIWLELYGESVKRQKPYKVFFDASSNTWLVTGSMPFSLFDSVKGGVAKIIIQKSDGKVLAVWHEK